jgi:xanthine dehydrogenase accessory factor
MKPVFLKIGELKQRSGGIVLSTIIGTRGSTPQKSGSSAIFDSKGLVFGTIGGGILEGRVEKIALEAAISGEPSIHHFELDKDIYSKEEAICGGQATVLIEPGAGKYSAISELIKESLRKKTPCILSTLVTIDSGRKVMIDRFILDDNIYSRFPWDIHLRIKTEAERLLAGGKSGMSFSKTELPGKSQAEQQFVLLESFYPPDHLVIAGAGHIGKSLCHLGKLLDFEVTVIDDRIEFANSENLPDADNIIVSDIGTAMSEIPKNNDTYIVIVTRGHNDDAMALKPCIGSNAAYVGMIGSITKIEKMHSSFISEGWATEEQWSSIHAPVGISINSKTVEEIAVSIAAELILVRNRKKKVSD